MGPLTRRRGRAVVVLVVALSLLSPGRATALDEYRVKAAFLYNFAKFVSWPEAGLPAGEARLTIGVLGADPFGAALDELQGKAVLGRSVAVRRLSAGDGLEGCQVLFVCPSEKGRYRRVVEGLGDAPVLTVGDDPAFTEAGGMVDLYLDGGRVRFRVNPVAARRAGLALSSRLLRLAAIVEDPRGAAP